MTAIPCPHCGEPINLSLRFCVSCGRSISAQDMQKLGGLKAQNKTQTTKRLDDSISHSSFDLAKKSYRMHRGVRQALATFSYVLLLLLLYYFVVRVVLKQDLPYPVNKMVQSVLPSEKGQ
jgi:uncharacterized membrane protein YvbJ